jgi:hypothetical protein
MLKKLPLLFLFGLLVSSCGGENPYQAGDLAENNFPESKIANRDTIPNDGVVDPQVMPTLNDTTDFPALRNYLIDLNRYLDDNRALRDSIIPNFWELCPVYYEMLREDRSERASRFHQILEDLPDYNSTNYQFLKTIVSPSDSTLLAYQKPLGAVFQGVTESTSIFETNVYSPAEQSFLNEIEDDSNTVTVQPDYLQSTTTYPFTQTQDSVYLFTKANRFKTSVTNFNYKSGNCISYYFYNLDPVESKPTSEEILIASPFKLELEFYWNEELDKILYERFQAVCADCPSSSRYQKSFARLKGYENFYFTYTREPRKETDDTYVPERSLIYYDGDLLYTVWSTNIDLFGCSCL